MIMNNHYQMRWRGEWWQLPLWFWKQTPPAILTICHSPDEINIFSNIVKRVGGLFSISYRMACVHDDVIKWKHFPRYWPFVRGIHRSPGNSPHKKPEARNFYALFDLRLHKRESKNGEAGDLWHHRAHYDVSVMRVFRFKCTCWVNKSTKIQCFLP